MIHRPTLDEIVEYSLSPAVRAARAVRMSLVPLLGGGGAIHEVVGRSNSRGTTITANATAGNDGAYTQLIASTANDYFGLHVILQQGGTVGTIGLVDIAIGGAGSEQVIVPDIPFVTFTANKRGGGFSFWLPIHVPKGSRIAARVHRSAVASQAINICLIGHTNPSRYMPYFHRATTYGTVLASARGTQVDPGGTANTLAPASPVELVASTTNPITAMFVMCTKAASAAAATTAWNSVEIYVGAASSEQVLIPEFPAWDFNDTADYPNQFSVGIGPFFVSLPAGVRLSARARSDNITAGVREQQVSVLCLD